MSARTPVRRPAHSPCLAGRGVCTGPRGDGWLSPASPLSPALWKPGSLVCEVLTESAESDHPAGQPGQRASPDSDGQRKAPRGPRVLHGTRDPSGASVARSLLRQLVWAARCSACGLHGAQTLVLVAVAGVEWWDPHPPRAGGLPRRGLLSSREPRLRPKHGHLTNQKCYLGGPRVHRCLRQW